MASSKCSSTESVSFPASSPLLTTARYNPKVDDEVRKNMSKEGKALYSTLYRREMEWQAFLAQHNHKRGPSAPNTAVERTAPKKEETLKPLTDTYISLSRTSYLPDDRKGIVPRKSSPMGEADSREHRRLLKLCRERARQERLAATAGKEDRNMKDREERVHRHHHRTEQNERKEKEREQLRTQSRGASPGADGHGLAVKVRQTTVRAGRAALPRSAASRQSTESVEYDDDSACYRESVELVTEDEKRLAMAISRSLLPAYMPNSTTTAPQKTEAVVRLPAVLPAPVRVSQKRVGSSDRVDAGRGVSAAKDPQRCFSPSTPAYDRVASAFASSLRSMTSTSAAGEEERTGPAKHADIVSSELRVYENPFVKSTHGVVEEVNSSSESESVSEVPVRRSNGKENTKTRMRGERSRHRTLIAETKVEMLQRQQSTSRQISEYDSYSSYSSLNTSSISLSGSEWSRSSSSSSCSSTDSEVDSRRHHRYVTHRRNDRHHHQPRQSQQSRHPGKDRSRSRCRCDECCHDQRHHDHHHRKQTRRNG